MKGKFDNRQARKLLTASELFSAELVTTKTLMFTGEKLGDHASMEKSVTIKSARDATRLIFSDAAGESFTAALESAHFSGRVVVSTYISGPPSLLFDEIAREWRGWERKKEWAALEDELRLAANSDLTGHVELLVVMRNYSDPADWRLEATLILEAGQLEELARAVKGVFHDVHFA